MNIFKFIKKSIKNGIDSNYSICCIITFIIRYPFASRKAIISNKSHKYQHVVCYLHKFYYWVTNQLIQYSYCRDCNNLQFNIKTCKTCNKIPLNPNERPYYNWINENGISKSTSIKEYKVP